MSEEASRKAENADVALSKLEECLEKVDQSQGGVVKLSKAEVEMLQQLEVVRDLMASMLRDRAILGNVFGDLRRTARARAVIEKMRLSECHADDGRVPTMMSVIVTVETLAKEAAAQMHAKPESRHEMEDAVDDVSEHEKDTLLEAMNGGRRPDMGVTVKTRMLVAKAVNKFAAIRDPVPDILAVEDVAELSKVEPNKKTQTRAWMIWMVHRVHLNDPTLTVLDFTNLHMPAITGVADSDKRGDLVAPKLVKAIASNRHIEKLILADSNLRSPDGRTLGNSIRENRIVRVLDISSNMLSPSDLEVLAQGVGASRSIEEFRCDGQHSGDAGRCRNDTLEALLNATKTNKRFVKLNMTIVEPHYNNEITRQIMANNELARLERRRTMNTLAADERAETAKRYEQDDSESDAGLDQDTDSDTSLAKDVDRDVGEAEYVDRCDVREQAPMR
mmetsp:Transcript_97852/g.276814  ORF Transcript_97852/g.276814 Transcript_97852/m.276814 type:complete len:447 (-) Transcript_97852:59-1399(-)